MTEAKGSTARDEDKFFVRQYRHATQCAREARLVAAIWLAGLLYCVGVIVGFGYVPVDRRPEIPPMVLGFPSWAFYGLYLPWIVQIGVAWWFAVFYLKDEEPYEDFPEDAPGR